MQFEDNLIYHVYNQGNNRQPIFFREENYLFFLEKMRKHILPHADFLCYCLMPNHFHWLIRVHSTLVEWREHVSAKPGEISKSSDDSESSDDLEISPGFADIPASLVPCSIRTLNQSIAILLRSYTRAINKQENRSGVLFRPHTKAKTSWIEEFITVDRYRKGPADFRAFPDDEYGEECFRYIHENPVMAGLCERSVDWQFSSARDYAGFRKGTLCNQQLARDVLFP